MSEAHERKAKRILERDWTRLRDDWLDYVPSISSPGKAPDDELSELADLQVKLAAITRLQVHEHVDDLPGLRSSLLHEAVFLLHKAAHVLASALVHVTGGMCTWSISSAYHSAFFGMKSVMGFLGVTVLESRNRHFLIDVWGTPHQPKKRASDPIIVLANTSRNEQRHLWAYFLRTLEKTQNCEDVLDEETRGVMLQLDYKDFARHRNDLHYRTSTWQFDDLHQCVVQQELGTRVDLDSERPDFSLVVAFTLVRAGYRMLEQLAATSGTLHGEWQLLQTWLSQPHSALYQQMTAQ